MIRLMQEKDVDIAAEIWLDMNIAAHSFINSAYWSDHFEMVKKMLPQAEVYVYEDNKEIRGFIGLNENYIEGLFVCREFQSHSIGKQLIDFAKTVRRELILRVYRKNTRAVKFYQREQFEIIQTGIDEDTNEEEYSMLWKDIKTEVL